MFRVVLDLLFFFLLDWILSWLFEEKISLLLIVGNRSGSMSFFLGGEI